MLAHFLFGTDLGSLVMVLAASAVLALVVWFALALVVALLGRALWRLFTRLPALARPGDRPTGG